MNERIQYLTLTQLIDEFTLVSYTNLPAHMHAPAACPFFLSCSFDPPRILFLYFLTSTFLYHLQRSIHYSISTMRPLTPLTVLLAAVVGIATCTSSTNLNLYPDITDLDNPRTMIHFNLHRKPIAPPYGTLSPDAALVSLTGIPKGYGYTASISIGTTLAGEDGPLFDMLVDTGSDMVVVTSTTCTAAECQQVPNRYDASASFTCQPNVINPLTGTTRWCQSYGDGSTANGTLMKDTIRFVSSSPASSSSASSSSQGGGGKVVLPNQTLLVVDQPGLALFKSYGPGVDGILGLNLRGPVINQTVIQNLQSLDATSCSSSSSSSSSSSMGFMSLWLATSLEPGQGGGLLLNAVDKTRFQGPIQWVNRGPSPFDWSIPLDRGILLVNSTNQDGLFDEYDGDEEEGTFAGRDFSSSFSRVTGVTTISTTATAPFLVPETDYSFAVLDSGSDGIYLQRFMYDALFPQIPGSKQLENGYWRVPCEGATDLVIGIQGQLYRIPYKDWVKNPSSTNNSSDPSLSMSSSMCQSRIYGSSPGPILLGTTFLKSVYTIFDFSHPGQERVGLAALA